MLAIRHYGLDSNVTQLLANLLIKPSVFYYLLIVFCNLASIKLLLLLLLFAYTSSSPLPRILAFTSHTVPSMHIYIKQPQRHYTLPQSNINWKPLTHIHSYPATCSSLISAISLTFHTLLACGSNMLV